MLHYSWAGSLNQIATTASVSIEPISKAAHLKAIFKRKMAVVSWNTGETPNGSVAVVLLPLPVSLSCFSSFSDSPLPFSFKDPCFIGSISSIGSGGCTDSGSSSDRDSTHSYKDQALDIIALDKHIYRWNDKI